MYPLLMKTDHHSMIDTETIRPAERFNYWQDVICKHFSPSENSTKGPHETFRAKMSYRSLGPIGLSRMHSMPSHSIRNPSSLRRDPLDCFFVSVLHAGNAVIRQGGRETEQYPGDFVLYDSATPFEYMHRTQFSGTWIRLPRSLLVNRMPRPEALTARSVAASDPLAELAANMLRSSFELDVGAETSAANRLANALVDLLTVAFETRSGLDPAGNPGHAAMLDRTKSYILSKLDDPDLDTAMLVKALGISSRTLNRIFALEATTPIRWIWRKRLERAHDMLRDGTGQRVTDVALSCGFSSFSHFTRAFKAEYGVTPRSLLDH